MLRISRKSEKVRSACANLLGKTFRVPGTCESCTPWGMSFAPFFAHLAKASSSGLYIFLYGTAEVNKYCTNIFNIETFFPNTQLLIRLLSFFFLAYVSLMANYWPKWLHISMLDWPPS